MLVFRKRKLQSRRRIQKGNVSHFSFPDKSICIWIDFFYSVCCPCVCVCVLMMIYILYKCRPYMSMDNEFCIHTAITVYCLHILFSEFDERVWWKIDNRAEYDKLRWDKHWIVLFVQCGFIAIGNEAMSELIAFYLIQFFFFNYDFYRFYFVHWIKCNYFFSHSNYCQLFKWH